MYLRVLSYGTYAFQLLIFTLLTVILLGKFSKVCQKGLLLLTKGVEY